jgi:hypothetical protein
MSQPVYKLELRAEHLVIIIKAFAKYKTESTAEVFYVNEILGDIKLAKAA